jgi:hypothetical protein
MENNSKNDRRHNALKHGAFAKELVILGENRNDFDELHESCIKELKPSGRMEEEVVLAIAKYMWRKRRIERLFIDEVNWLREHPDTIELRAVSQFNEHFIQKGARCSDVWARVGMLPENYRATIQKEFKCCPSTEYDDEWIDQVKKLLGDLLSLAPASTLVSSEERQFVGETAAKIRELSAKQTALEDRLDMMIDKALKRLATLKTFKQVVAIQETSRPRRISAS